MPSGAMNRLACRATVATALLLAAAPLGALCIGSIVVNAAPLQFLTYDPLAIPPRDATGTVSVGCSGIGLLDAFTVSLNIGSGGSYAGRHLVYNVSNTLAYNIYTDPARTRVWGNGSAGTFPQSYAGLLSLTTVDMYAYGRIPAGQDRPAGAYTTTITVTVDF